MDFALTDPPTFELKQLGLLRYRGRRGGGTVRLDNKSVSHQGNSVIMNENVSESYIPTVYNRPAIKSYKHNHASVRPRVLVQCARSAEVNMKNDKQHQQPPSIYMINSGSLAKPHANVCMYVFNTYLVSAPLRGFSGALRAVPSQFRIILISCLCQTDTF